MKSKNAVRTRFTFRRPLLACMALASLAIGKAFAQALPPGINVDIPELPTLMPAPPPTGYPPTVAPTATSPYFAPPAWSQKLAPNVRFVILSQFDNDAVLDRETGLVWTRRTVDDAVDIDFAEQTCRHLILGERMGWRLPTVAELQSLLHFSDTEPVSEPRLPAGHPFLLSPAVENHDYWASDYYSGVLTGSDSVDVFRFVIRLSNGRTAVLNRPSAGGDAVNRGLLCVRGARAFAEHL